jgi:uncharacterized protein YprB with RNaseH-like and TPR domain
MKVSREQWSEAEDKLIMKLRKSNVPYKNMVEYFEGRSQDALRNRAWVLREQTKNDWLEDEIVAAFDIETTNLKADVGFVLSWYIVRSDGKEVGAKIKRSEILNGKLDKRILKEFLEAIKEVDVLVGYYSTRFDVPFMRTRCEIQGLEFPSYGHVKHMDLYYLIRAKLQLRNNRLATALHALGLEDKTHVGIDIWNEARRGVQKAIDDIYEYNINDVRITYQLYKRVKKYRKWTRRSI